MSKMKHLLRKLHIGGNVETSRPTDPQRLAEIRHGASAPPPPSQSPSVPSPSSSSSVPSGRITTASDEFNFFEEEYQVQLALAISASDPDARDDPESFQIKAAKRISLGCSPSPDSSLVEFLSLRYWNYNVVNYDEKVMDGFYDVHGVISNPSLQGKMPSLVDLQAASIADNVDYEVVLVDRTVDMALEQLERKAVSIALECRAGELGPLVSGLVQRIADLVVDSMGGLVGDADDMLRRWTARSYDLRTSLNTIVLPLGCLDIGLSRHRALLFKVLSDRINLPCRLVKGSYYTGTDEGAVNIIKIDHESEFIIDLMGAPGTLIPAEIPSFHPQNSMNSVNIAQAVNNLLLAPDIKADCQFERNGDHLETNQHAPNLVQRVGSGLEESSRIRAESSGNDMNLAERNQMERFEHEFGKLLPLLNKPRGSSLGAEEAATPSQMKVKDVSKYVISAAQNPEFAQKLHAVLLESGASPPPDLFSDIKPQQDPNEKNLLGPNNALAEERRTNMGFSYSEQSLIPFVGMESLIDGVVGCEDNLRHPYRGLIQNERQDADGCNLEEPKQHSSTEKLGPKVGDVCVPALSNAISLGSCVPSSGAGFIVLGNGINELVLVDTVAAESCQKQFENALVDSDVECSQIGHNKVRNAKNVETERLVCPQEGQENIRDSLMRFRETISNDPHIASVSHNERTNPVLDDVAEWEIRWEDLQIGERIGLGSYGEVYHADWNSTEVAVKKFLDQDFSGDALEQFRCEVKIMLRLRHPNVVLFMGAVTRPPNLSILTEFLPRGSLYRLLHRPNVQIDEKRRLRMALDVAKGMNYLHTSHPTIVHRDLKSPNLLVDKNWVVKVCDFGLSRLKHHTFLSSKSTAGTPEWMAPEVLRNEPSNEKCDVYSFGVILWELATLRMPWSGMNPMQVVGAVGFQNRRLDIPKEVDPMAAQIICDCWQSEPNLRPSFSQLMAPLKHLQRLVVQIT